MTIKCTKFRDDWLRGFDVGRGSNFPILHRLVWSSLKHAHATTYVMSLIHNNIRDLINNIINKKINKNLGVIQKLSNILSCDVLHLVPEARLFNICSWLSQKFGSNAASRIFFGWLTAYTKSGLNSAYSHRVAFRSCTFCFSSSKALKPTLLNTVCTVTVYLC